MRAIKGDVDPMSGEIGYGNQEKVYNVTRRLKMERRRNESTKLLLLDPVWYSV